MRRFLAAGILTAVVTLLVTIMVRTSGRQAEVRPGTPPANPGVTAALQGMKFAENKDGKTQWELEAEQVAMDQTGKRSHLLRPRLTVHNLLKGGPIVVTAATADYDVDSKDIRMNGDVTARNQEGATFVTEQATYQAARRVLVADGPVRFTSPGLSVQGIGMEFYPDSRDIRVRRQVTTRVVPTRLRR